MTTFIFSHSHHIVIYKHCVLDSLCVYYQKIGVLITIFLFSFYNLCGVLHAKMTNWIIYIQRYEESLADFQHAFKALRGNQLIDYKALGLRYKLYACEVSI